MTRGTAHIILKDKLFSTTEFNGDMYPEGKGDYMLEDLRKVNTKEDLEKLNKKWCKDYGYKNESDDKLYEILPHYATFQRWEDNERVPEEEKKVEIRGNKKMLANWKKDVIDFRIDYYKYWFSDWIFFVNRSGKDITIHTQEQENEPSETITLKNGDTIRLNFGYLPEESKLLTETLEEAGIKTS